LGVTVDAVQISTAIARMESWLEEFNDSNLTSSSSFEYRSKVVTLTNVHAVIAARNNPVVAEALAHADMVCPDGMPLVWVGRRQGFSLPQQVSGPELMKQFCESSAASGHTHYFLGGAPGVATSLASKLLQRNPNLRVAGIYSPPFRVPSPQEDQELIDRINAAKPDVLWVALGCPKQEVWVQAHRDRLRVGVMLGVGQAFDIHAGRLKQAPYWMRSNGLEWLYRLFREPNRLWKRYLLTNSQFILLQAWEFFFKSGSR
jgi:N-acetylglucosaminyldiphosphoundecaprenol N-acetyl-beta-D-mannosaminyltransferase